VKLIKEQVEEVKLVVEEKLGKGKEYFLEGVFLQSNLKNRNGRMYPREIMEKEVNRYSKEYIDKNRAFGELGHPDTPSINLDRTAILIKSLKPDGDNWIGKAKVMDTPYGKIVKNLIDEGAQLGVSSRGLGSLKSVGGVNMVQDVMVLWKMLSGFIMLQPVVGCWQNKLSVIFKECPPKKWHKIKQRCLVNS